MTCVCPKCGQQIRFRAPKKSGKYKYVCTHCKEPFIMSYQAQEPATVEQHPEDTSESQLSSSPQSQPSQQNTPKQSGVEEKTKPVAPVHRIWRDRDKYSTIGGLLEKRSGFFTRDRLYPLSEGRQLIGRKDAVKTSQIMFNDEYMSRQSLEINVEKHEEYGTRFFIYVMTVKRQKNPILHNDSPLMNGEEIVLHIGDTIKIGKTFLILQ